MKKFNELTKKELASLTEMQIEAYIDIELASQNISKPINAQIDFPTFVKVPGQLPEKDMSVYEVDGYNFADIETAQKFTNFISTLTTLDIGTDWSSSEYQYYVKGLKNEHPQIQIKKMYSLAKYEACKEEIKNILLLQKEQKNRNEKEVDSVINYAAIDEIKYSITNCVRGAIRFFAEANKIASDYNKYFDVTGENEQALTVLFTVYNIQDEEMKEEVKKIISEISA